MSENDTVDTIKTNEDGQSGEQDTASQGGKSLDSAFAKLRREKEEAEKKAKEATEALAKAQSDPRAPVTKEDLYKMVEKQAIEALAISESEMDKEIVENKDAVLDYYKPRSGRESKESIMKDLRSAHAAWRFDNPKQDTTGKDTVRDLQGGVQRGRGAPQVIVEAKVEDSRFKAPSGPESWYDKKPKE